MMRWWKIKVAVREIYKRLKHNLYMKKLKKFTNPLEMYYADGDEAEDNDYLDGPIYGMDW